MLSAPVHIVKSLSNRNCALKYATLPEETHAATFVFEPETRSIGDRVFVP